VTKAIFTTPDFAGPFRKNAAQILGPLAGQRLSYLEIGVLEGRSGVWMLENVLTHPKSLYVGIDCYIQTKARAAELATNARRNLAVFGRKAVFHQGRSFLALSRLPRRPTFDIAYIDGDHSACGVALDTCLVWPLVRPDGIIAFDDWTHPRFRALPRAVTPLLAELPHQVLLENEQLWIRKLAA